MQALHSLQEADYTYLVKSNFTAFLQEIQANFEWNEVKFYFLVHIFKKNIIWFFSIRYKLALYLQGKGMYLFAKKILISISS